MRLSLVLAATLLTIGCGRAATGSEASATLPESPKTVSIGRIAAQNPSVKIVVVSPAFGADGAMDLRHSRYGANISPPLRWTPVAGAGAYALIVEDPDAPSARPFVHWLVWNIPAGVAALGEGAPPPGAVQGRNGADNLGYFGPRPPAGTGVHHYHFQVFALDRPLTLASGASIGALTAAMNGHVLADGEWIGTFAAPADQ